ncbi:MAG: TlpA family protein disulfide reductase [Gemmatimonadaceae bacterium]|nr:TlpA family protein disulfide reductase [Gemmatimonadaceae bacterium]
MANELTGDFDVVAQFAIPAANRVLAAMHRSERFAHSIAIRVDDIRPPFPDVATPSIVATVDTFGHPTANQQQIGNLASMAELVASTNPAFFALDPVVNLGNAGVLTAAIEPSNLQGRAQVQLFPPSIEVPDSSGTNVTVRIQIIARYFPDPNTSPVAEFVRGELSITAPVNQVASQVANVVEIDIKGVAVRANFVSQFSSRPLSAGDVAAINLLIRNALKTSFLPSNSTLPSNIRHMQFKTMQGAANAIAVLLNLEGGPGTRNSVTNIFLDDGDHFAIGVSSDFVRAAFQPTIDTILSQPVDPVSFTINGIVNTWNITYTFVLNSASVELKDGEIVLTIKGRATTASWPPNFDFTVKQRFSLEPNGATANLVVGDLSLDTSSWIIDRFRGRATATIRKVRNRALRQSNARATVRRMLSADENLGGFLDSLLKPARTTPIPQTRGVRLTYSAAEIRAAGIILHGSLAVTDWPPAHVEFEKIPVNNDGGFGVGGITGVNQGPDYSALKSWIPGGTVRGYEWKSLGQGQTGFVDENRFVFITPSPGIVTGDIIATPVSGYAPFCLTVHGSRLSSSGPVVAQAVTARVCAVNLFPLIDSVFAGDLPLIVLAQPDPRGMVRVMGHTSARQAERGSLTPNLIVHFGDRASAGNLEVVLQALRECGRRDAPTAIVAVLSRADLANARYAEGITYAEDQDGIWERRFDVRIAERPVTLIVTPNGKVALQHDGEMDVRTLAAALRKHLVVGERVEPTLPPSAVRIGQPPPNFLFTYAPGRELTLRKIAGRPAVLVFWRSSSQQSIDLLRDLERVNATSGERGPVVLAINDGEAVELAGKVAAEQKLPAIVVTDPARSIAIAYGVNTWPTTVWIDTLGSVRAIRHGYLAGSRIESPFDQTTADPTNEYATAQEE